MTEEKDVQPQGQVKSRTTASKKVWSSFQEDESLGGQRGASPSSRTTTTARNVTAAAKAVM
jgi:hypothetical protein